MIQTPLINRHGADSNSKQRRLVLSSTLQCFIVVAISCLVIFFVAFAPHSASSSVSRIAAEPVWRPSVLVTVLSTRSNFERRAGARRSWMRRLASNQDLSSRSRVMFVVAAEACPYPQAMRKSAQEINTASAYLNDCMPKNFNQEVPLAYRDKLAREDQALRDEAALFDDVVQVPGVDTYRGSARKMLNFFEWLATRDQKHNQFDFVLKLDDDTLPNMDAIFDMLDNRDWLRQRGFQPDRKVNYWWSGEFRLLEANGAWFVPKTVSSRFTLPFSLNSTAAALSGHGSHWMARQGGTTNGIFPIYPVGCSHLLSWDVAQWWGQHAAELSTDVWVEDVALGIWFDAIPTTPAQAKSFQALPTDPHDDDLVGGDILKCRYFEPRYTNKLLGCRHKDILVLGEVSPQQGAQEGHGAGQSLEAYEAHWANLQQCGQLCGCPPARPTNAPTLSPRELNKLELPDAVAGPWGGFDACGHWLDWSRAHCGNTEDIIMRCKRTRQNSQRILTNNT